MKTHCNQITHVLEPTLAIERKSYYDVARLKSPGFTVFIGAYIVPTCFVPITRRGILTSGITSVFGALSSQKPSVRCFPFPLSLK